ncbi:MAG TPA: acetamidase/formamidase family protein [Synergistaceae bacterium]|nr:acetamidase/formamidase family protein [Synergistaceae bacterium]HPJ24833.1 acetamidase/formamidase family protein [Synergistaceae bacterium]HPQ36476.1 acetamidase/formamidase family protein [Synergistaceae bacterium]
MERTLSAEHLIYDFGPEHAPVFSVDFGESFWVESPDCYGGQIRSSRDLRPHIDISRMDASTGPIAVRGAVPGEAIQVYVEDILCGSQGIMVTSPGLGVLGEKITEPDTKILPVYDGMIHFSEKIKIPLREPMIGVLGVAPEKEAVHCAVPGDHGGNMDTKDVKRSNSVYFPVFVEGANVALGDLHANMGDGELSGTGVEIAGKVKLRITRERRPLRMPLVKSPEEYMVIASDTTFDKTVKKAVAYGVELLQQAQDLSFPDAYRLVSALGDIRIGQVVNEKITLRLCFPRWCLDPYFRE